MNSRQMLVHILNRTVQLGCQGFHIIVQFITGLQKPLVRRLQFFDAAAKGLNASVRVQLFFAGNFLNLLKEGFTENQRILPFFLR